MDVFSSQGDIGSSNGVDSSLGDVHSSRDTNTRVAVRIISVAQRVKLVN
jgi:hypothetical protein